MNDAAPHDSSTDRNAPEVVSELLVTQAREIHALSKELAKSYEKELTFFRNLESRDKLLKSVENKLTKKIWWLETERRQLMEREEQLTERISKLESDLERTRNSKLGKVQRQMWRARKVVRSWR
ncbi:hypothetical protein [Kocuria carniphila]|uniref:hypothetical protein n=1 Tax=Kocuria carniphila TaxID=262208 RepID=UPI0028ECBB37|nr:hypothetical protein [Kocuria carniphila]